MRPTPSVPEAAGDLAAHLRAARSAGHGVVVDVPLTLPAPVLVPVLAVAAAGRARPLHGDAVVAVVDREALADDLARSACVRLSGHVRCPDESAEVPIAHLAVQHIQAATVLHPCRGAHAVDRFEHDRGRPFHPLRLKQALDRAFAVRPAGGGPAVPIRTCGTAILTVRPSAPLGRDRPAARSRRIRSRRIRAGRRRSGRACRSSAPARSTPRCSPTGSSWRTPGRDAACWTCSIRTAPCADADEPQTGTAVDPVELVHRHPSLFHVAAAGSWPAIRRHGLLTTEQIVLSGGYDAKTVEAALRRRRADVLRLHHPVLGAVVIRDQGPLRLPILERRLVGATVEQWIGMLNDRVFLWLHPEKLLGLLTARRYRHLEHDVRVVDTAGLLRDHGDRVRLSAINSGATLWPSAPERGPDTFRTVADYPYAERRRGRSDATAIAELVVVGGVADIRRHVVRVERWHGPVHRFDLEP